MSRKLIVGNWKMNPETRDQARRLMSDIKRASVKAKGADIVVCPPFTYLRDAKEILNRGKAALGAQDMFWEGMGAYTGEISPVMLRDLGVRFSIIGHSERRSLGETDEMVNKKVKAALKYKIVPIICVGEKERDTHGYYLATVKGQVEQAFSQVAGTMIKNCVIAYEPVWAVGNKDFESVTPHDAVEMSIFIRKTLADRYGAKKVSEIRVLYGGSVNAKNAGDFLNEKDIAGLLVGRESLDAKKFLAIAASS
ncbi:MAG: triose-phosphate isomerase [Candidatus Paceibacterota bacterium]|jgi:triosephosphate isomerase